MTVSLVKVTPPTPYFATKYDSAADEVVALLSDPFEGFGTDATGDTEAPTGWFALVTLDDKTSLDFHEDSGNYPPGDLVGETARAYGVTAADVLGTHIVTHDSQGFVHIETFESPEAGQLEYACRAARFEEWSELQESDPLGEGDGVYVCPVAGHGYHCV